jgi:hypothetical protein
MFSQAAVEESKVVIGQAHKLVTALKTHDVYQHKGYTTEDKLQIGNLHPTLGDQIAQAVRFDITDARKLSFPTASDRSLIGHLPYPLCYFEFDGEGATRADGTSLGPIRLMVLARDLGTEVISVFLRAHPPGERYFSMGFGARWRVEGDEILWEPDLLTEQPPPDFANPQSLADVTAAFLRPVLSYLALLNKPGAQVTRLIPPSKLASSREKSGKPPLFDFHRIKLNAINRSYYPGSDEGSDREGPRLHMRRAHARRLASGKEIWVRSTIVGRASAGALGKDFVS